MGFTSCQVKDIDKTPKKYNPMFEDEGIQCKEKFPETFGLGQMCKFGIVFPVQKQEWYGDQIKYNRKNQVEHMECPVVSSAPEKILEYAKLLKW